MCGLLKVSFNIMCIVRILIDTVSLNNISLSLRDNCPYLEFFWSAFSRTRIEYGEIRSISPYSVRMRENTDQKNSEYGHFPCCIYYSNSELPVFFFLQEMYFSDYNTVLCKRKYLIQLSIPFVALIPLNDILLI